MRRLEGARAELVTRARAERNELKDPPSAVVAQPPGRADTLFWATAGGGLALLVGGGVMGVMALKREDDVADFVAGEGQDGSLTRRDELISQADSFATLSDVGFVAGGLLVAASALLYFLREPEPPETRGAFLELTPGGLRGRY